MGSKWRKAKLALSCLYVPSTSDDSHESAGRVSDASLSSSSLSPLVGANGSRLSMTPTPSSSGLRLSKQGSKSSKSTCAICLTNMKPGHGHAIFTAECSHSFHFHCIASNVKHGNQMCPVCRAKWKEIPVQKPSSNLPRRGIRASTVGGPQDDGWVNILRRLPPPRADTSRHVSLIFQTPEPGLYDDDEAIDHPPEIVDEASLSKDGNSDRSIGAVEVKTYPEVSAVSRLCSSKDFTVLIHLKACSFSPSSQSSRAPIDLVTVLDVSGSMAGTKLALLKRAMGFVIQHLGSSDRLSVIAFSSTARRLFPLRRMTETGRQEALQAINGLTSNGGTNIAEGLKKAAKVMMDRKWKNSVGSIILLSDGQDTYIVNSPVGSRTQSDYQSLLPTSIQQNSGKGFHTAVHTFGFGADHDSAAMHSISECSGGTFSFIEEESVIQDAFAQCIGGLLSVVVQELQVRVECVHPGLKLGSVKAGSYKTSMNSDGRVAFVNVGDLYAEEERDFLVTVDIPSDESPHNMSLLKVTCAYTDAISKESTASQEADEVKISRPERTENNLMVSLEVDRQRNRLRAAEAMAEARATAERGDLAGAAAVLDSCYQVMSETVSMRGGDRLCVALGAELKEMQERMVNRRVYESSGRAYVLSGLSSHSWQRATARGDSTDSTSLVQAYQTQTMADMVMRSQTMVFDNIPSPRPQPQPQARRLRQAYSFPARPQPR